MTAPRGFAVCFVLLSLHHAQASDGLLPPNQPMEQVIDHFVDAKLKTEKVTPSAQIDDANLIHRLTLDLLGRTPLAFEVQEFTQSKDPAKRTQLVDRLMNSPAFVRHQASLFERMLVDSNRGGDGLRDYLKRSLAENKRWNQIFRELVIADESEPARKGTSEFLKPRVNDLDKLTNDVSINFFGVNVSCAQCHDHPLVEDWKMDHYYGMKTFFSRTVDANGFLTERSFGVVKFKPPKGPERNAKMMFLTGKVVEDASMREPKGDEEKKDRERIEKAKKEKKAPAPPAFSPRQKLVETALQPDQSAFFAKNLVNRMIHRFFGYGLVMPLDQMHSENPASHPELLEWMARDTQANGYDIRRLIRGIVLSKTYSRSSRWSGSQSELPGQELFAVSKLKALTPAQLFTSMKLATLDQQLLQKLKPEEREKRLESYENSARGMARLIPAGSDDPLIGVSESLVFSNNEQIQRDIFGDHGESILQSLKKVTDRNQAIQQLFQNIFNRAPSRDENEAFLTYLERRSDRLNDAYKQLLWAMLTSSEFRFNY
jgi:hypothetical protein